MTTVEFERLVMQGRGNAVLLLQKETQKTPFRDAVIYAAFNDLRYDGQCSDDQSWFIYELIKCFDDADDIVAEIISKSEDITIWEESSSHYIKMLSLLTKHGYKAAGDALRKIYTDEYSKMASRKSIPEDYDLGRDMYCNAAVEAVIAGIIKPEKVFADIEKLLLMTDIFNMGDFDLSIDEIRKFIDEETLDVPVSDSLKMAYNAEKARTNKIFEENYNKNKVFEDVDCLIQHIKDGKELNVGIKYYLKEINESQLEKLSQLAYAETDVNRKYLLYSIIPKIKLPVEKLIEEAQKYEYMLDDSDSLENRLILRILDKIAETYTGQQEIKNYFSELRAKGYNEITYRALLSKIDPEAFRQYVKSLTVSENDDKWHKVGFVVFDTWKQTPETAFTDLLYHIYDTTLCCTCRYSAIKIMAYNGLLTDEIRAEIVFDSDQETRDFLK